MAIAGIDVRLSRLKLMSIDDCDTDVALAAIKDAIETALVDAYPAAAVSVVWQIRGPDMQFHVVNLARDEEEEDEERTDLEAEVAQLVESAGHAAIEGLFDGPPVRWMAWPR